MRKIIKKPFQKKSERVFELKLRDIYLLTDIFLLRITLFAPFKTETT